MEKAICRNCNKEYFFSNSSMGIYCSNKCQRDFEVKIKIENWIKGVDNPINSNGLLRPWARKFLFNKYKNRCSICGWNEINNTTGRIPLEVDHVDGCYQNNLLTNLRLLCPNCHSLTSTYKNSNKGKGRTFRINK